MNDPENLLALSLLALQFYENKDYDKAIIYSKKVIQMHDSFDMYTNLANAQLALEQYDETYNCAKKILSIRDPSLEFSKKLFKKLGEDEHTCRVWASDYVLWYETKHASKSEIDR